MPAGDIPVPLKPGELQANRTAPTAKRQHSTIRGPEECADSAVIADLFRNRNRLTGQFQFVVIEGLCHQGTVTLKQDVAAGWVGGSNIVDPKCRRQQAASILVLRLDIERTNVDSAIFGIRRIAQKEEMPAIGQESRPSMINFLPGRIEG